MIPDIKELNFPIVGGEQIATLEAATVELHDMGDMLISADVKISGVPDFSHDWAVLFHGHKFVMSLREPQGSKDNDNLDGTYNLTFKHWAQDEMKRYLFFTYEPVATGTAVADKYIAPLNVNLGDFCVELGRVLEHYYGDAITVDLNPGFIYKQEPTPIEINHTFIWDVLTKIYETYAVHWTIEAPDTPDKYVIRVGYADAPIDHVFEYGFDGGLMKVERSVQSDDIRNVMLGRGGEKNLPYRYFKKKDEDNPLFHEDPDWVEELSNIYFDRLRGATFRSYIQGWKFARYEEGMYPDWQPVDRDEAYAPWAWDKGATDTKFDPVEYVKDDESIAKYGVRMTGLDDQDDIYSTIQGVVIDPYGRIDEAVDVEQVVTDEDPEELRPEADVVPLDEISGTVTVNANQGYGSITLKSNGNFTVPPGKYGNLSVSVTVLKAMAGLVAVDIDKSAQIDGTSAVKCINVHTGEVHVGSGIPGGEWRYEVAVKVQNKLFSQTLAITVGDKSPELTLSVGKGDDSWLPTFNVWVKNIWQSEPKDDETPSQYAERVWAPILGDRLGEEAKLMFTTGALAVSEDYEFTIVAIPEFDTSKSIEVVDEDGSTHSVPSHWRIKCRKSDADLESLGVYVPSTKRQGAPGDHFVFLGIDMNHYYTLWAEIKLDDLKTDELNKVKEVQSTLNATLDRVRISNGGMPGALIDELAVGKEIRIFDPRFTKGPSETRYIQQLTYTFRKPTNSDAALNPDVEITLGNEYESASNPISQLQGEVTAIQRQLGSVSNIEKIVNQIGDRKYLRKDGISDRSLSPTVFNEELKSGTYNKGGFGWAVDPNGNAELLTAVVRSMLRSPNFVNGMTGEGFRLWLDEQGLAELELDKLTVRQVMTVFELVIDRIRSVGGQIIVSAANGKVKEVADNGDNYTITFEADSYFQPHDLMRCQVFNGDDIRGYWVEVADATANSVTVAKSEFGDYRTLPVVGDECVLMGNTRDEKRQNLISISATEDGEPRIDVLDGVSTKSFNDSLRARLGCLDGIKCGCAPDKQPSGYGLYADNAHLHGTFILTNGNDVLTQFAIMEGKISSAVESVRQDLSQSYLSNPTFIDGGDGLDKWHGGESASFFMFGTKWLWADDMAVARSKGVPYVLEDDSRHVLCIDNQYIIQNLADFNGLPELPVNADGKKQAVPVYLSFYYKCIEGGELNVGFENVVTAGYEAHTPFAHTVELQPTSGYQQMTLSGMWNATGNFYFSFSGKINIYMLVMSKDSIASLTTTYKTLVEQTDRLVSIIAANFDGDGKVLAGSSILVEAGKISQAVYSRINGELKKTGIDITTGEVTISADKVTFTDSDNNTQALLENGKLNLDAIDAENLAAGRVVVQPAEERAKGDTNNVDKITILPEDRGMIVYDQDGAVCQEFTGKIKQRGPADFFGASSSTTLIATNASGSAASTASSDTYPATADKQFTLAEWDSATQSTIKFTSGTIAVSAKAADRSEADDSIDTSAEASVNIVLQEFSDATRKTMVSQTTVAAKNVFARSRKTSDGPTDTANKYAWLNLANVSAKSRGAGYFRLMLKTHTYAKGRISNNNASMVSSTASVMWGNNVSGGSIIAATARNDVYASYYFANGFCLGKADNDYAAVWHNGKNMCFEFRNPNGGLSIGEWGMFTFVGDLGMLAHPNLIFKAVYSYSDTTYKSDYLLGIGNKFPTLHRTGVGKVTFYYPTEWVNALGSRLDPYRQIVHIIPINPNYNISASIANISGNSLSFSLGVSGTMVDSGFMIEIQII